MSDAPLLIAREKNYARLFSICTIVNSWEEYRLMKESFTNNGFSENCEYLVADNTDKNNFDAYAAIRRFLAEAQGQYIMVVHQDVRCVDPMSKLSNTLDSLERYDPRWAICGNAGGNGYRHFYFNLDNNGKVMKSDPLPAKVTSLDENLLIIKAGCHLTLSADINSFHLYGTDLCIIADFLGYSCYVVDFMVTHLSLGNLKQLEEYKPEFIGKYGNKLRERFIQTTCTKFYLSRSASKNNFYNNSFVFFWLKAAHRLSNVFKK
jgi:hypothetical protein